MEKLPVEKNNDYVPEREQKRVKRIAKIMELEGYNYHGGRSDFADCINMKPQNFSRCMNSGRVSDKTCEKIIKAFPSYKLDWLLGYSDSMTAAEGFINALNETREETRLLHTGFFSFTQLSGFKIDVPSLEGRVTVEDALDKLRNYCTISKDSKSVTFSIDELNNFENEICDYIEFRLQHIMK